MDDANGIYGLGSDSSVTLDSAQSELGGKAANLLELTRAGLPVPSGFVIGVDAYRRFCAANGIDERLSQLFDGTSGGCDSTETHAAIAREYVLDGEIPESLRRSIEDAYEAGGSGDVAVRSSATAEDLDDASFAGQQDTYLNVRGGDDLFESIKRCWASLYTARAVEYRREMSFDPTESRMAVVVQRMVDADKSGVLFTVDPSSGERRMTVEAAPGLGEAVVGGTVTPDQYVVDGVAGDVVSETINAQRVEFVRDTADGGVVERPVPEAERDTPVLGASELYRLVEIGARIEDHYGTPQDVEWAITGSDVHVLQARPITTLEDGNGTKTPVSNSDGRGFDGLGASSGRATGAICFDPIEVVVGEDEAVLVRERTSPADMVGIKEAEAIVTAKGGTTSHAAIVARELDKPAVVGCNDLCIDAESGILVVDGLTFEAGDPIHVDGTAGRVEFPEGD